MVVWIQESQESQRANQLKQLSGPDPGLEMAHPNVYHIYKLLEHMQGASPTVPKLPDLHDTGEQKDM